MSNELRIRNMTRAEVSELVEWAAIEGWNPGLHDADLFWATDPEAFISAELDEELIGGGAITSYNGEFGFMGFFIVRPEYRGQGYGNTIWLARRDRLLARLQNGASIGMDGVFTMQEYYARGGFVFTHRNLRFRTDIPAHAATSPVENQDIIPLAEISFDQVLDYDRTCFPASRPAFLKAWVSQPDALALGCQRDGSLQGFGIVRRCREGCKIGPLFADDAETAAQVFADVLPLLNQNGQIVICLPNVRHWSTFYHLYVRGIWPANDRGIFDKTHLHFFARRNILQLIREAGLEVVLEKRNVRIIEPWSWTNIPGKLLDWWPFRPFLHFNIFMCVNLTTMIL